MMLPDTITRDAPVQASSSLGVKPSQDPPFSRQQALAASRKHPMAPRPVEDSQPSDRGYDDYWIESF